MYFLQLHLVHWNTKYELFSKAVQEPDGLAVVGIFLEIGPEDHPELEKVLKNFDKINYKGMKHDFDEDIDPTKFLPGIPARIPTVRQSIRTNCFLYLNYGNQKSTCCTNFK